MLYTEKKDVSINYQLIDMLTLILYRNVFPVGCPCSSKLFPTNTDVATGDMRLYGDIGGTRCLHSKDVGELSSLHKTSAKHKAQTHEYKYNEVIVEKRLLYHKESKK